MSLLELRKKLLAVLLVSFMALGMAACSSTDDPAEDDAASAEAPTDEGFDCSIYPAEDAREECEAVKDAAGE